MASVNLPVPSQVRSNLVICLVSVDLSSLHIDDLHLFPTPMQVRGELAHHHSPVDGVGPLYVKDDLQQSSSSNPSLDGVNEHPICN